MYILSYSLCFIQFMVWVNEMFGVWWFLWYVSRFRESVRNVYKQKISLKRVGRSFWISLGVCCRFAQNGSEAAGEETAERTSRESASKTLALTTSTSKAFFKYICISGDLLHLMFLHIEDYMITLSDYIIAFLVLHVAVRLNL